MEDGEVPGGGWGTGGPGGARGWKRRPGRGASPKKPWLGEWRPLPAELRLVHLAPVISALITPEEALRVVSWSGKRASWEADVGRAHVKLARAAAVGRRGRGAALRKPRLGKWRPWPRQGKSGQEFRHLRSPLDMAGSLAWPLPTLVSALCMPIRWSRPCTCPPVGLGLVHANRSVLALYVPP